MVKKKAERRTGRRGVPRGPYGVEKSFRGVPKTLYREEEDSDMHDLLYRNCDVERYRARIGEFVFDPDRWKRQWTRATNPNNFHMAAVRGLRKIAQIGTLQALCSRKYFLPNGETVHLSQRVMEKASQSTRMYSEGSILKFLGAREITEDDEKERDDYTSEVMVVRGDCLESAEWLIRQKHLNPVVLNMANARTPGGGWMNAAGAQEENLHRRTSLAHCLSDPYHIDSDRSWRYPIPEFGAVYTPKALYFRASEANCYGFLKRPLRMSFVSVAAYAHPPLTEENGELKITSKNAEKTKKKIRAMLATAEMNGHDSLVLSAFGCGAFRNPPKHMAQLFKNVIEKEFPTSFKFIIFAIIEDHNSKKSHNTRGNVLPFSETFNTEAVGVENLPIKEDDGSIVEDTQIEDVVEDLVIEGVDCGDVENL